MAQEILLRKRIHKNCGGEVEIIKLRNSFRDLVRCKKCGEKWKVDYNE